MTAMYDLLTLARLNLQACGAVPIRFLAAVTTVDNVRRHFPGGWPALLRLLPYARIKQGLVILESQSGGELSEWLTTLRAQSEPDVLPWCVLDGHAGPFTQAEGIEFLQLASSAWRPTWWVRAISSANCGASPA